MNKVAKLAVHWPNFGPYHLARLNAAYEYCINLGISLIGLEISGSQKTYAWMETSSQRNFECLTVFPAGSYEIALAHPFRLLSGIWNSLNSIKPDVLAINGYSSLDSIIIIAWARLHSKKLILMSDSKVDDQRRSIIKERVKRIFIRNFSTALCAGKPQRQYLQILGLPGDKIFTSYDVVDNDYFRSRAIQIRVKPDEYRDLPGLSNDPRPFFLASSRFIPRKNLTGLLNAFASYCEIAKSHRMTPWRLVILGDGEQRSEIEELIKQLGLGNDVTLAGVRQINEIPAYYALARVFIHPALQDQWGLVVNEAMASGLPVLVSRNCGCAQDLLVEGVNGYSFDPSDTTGLAELMIRMSDGSVDLADMGRNSLEIISQWTPQKFAESLYKASLICMGKTLVSGRK